MGSEFIDKNSKWKCAECGSELEVSKVNLTYLEGNFEVELLKCPVCKMVLVTEDLAMGKMLDVEKSLEDK